MYCLGSRFKQVDFLILFLFLLGEGPHVPGSTAFDIYLCLTLTSLYSQYNGKEGMLS